MTAAQITYRPARYGRLDIYVNGKYRGHLIPTLDRTYQARLNGDTVLWARTMFELEADIAEYLGLTTEEEEDY